MSSDDNFQTVLKRLDDLEQRLEAKDADCEALKEKVLLLEKDNSDKFESLVTTIRRLEEDISALSSQNKALEGNIASLVGKLHRIDHMTSIIAAVENRIGDLYKSSVSVKVNAKGGLTTGQDIKLDACISVYHNGGMWDSTNCYLDPPCDGLYCVAARFLQKGAGVIRMRLRGCGDSIPYYLGRTRKDGDLTTGLAAIQLKRGQKIWLLGMRWDGDAEIDWCRLFCWLAG